MGKKRQYGNNKNNPPPKKSRIKAGDRVVEFSTSKKLKQHDTTMGLSDSEMTSKSTKNRKHYNKNKGTATLRARSNSLDRGVTRRGRSVINSTSGPSNVNKQKGMNKKPRANSVDREQPKQPQSKKKRRERTNSVDRAPQMNKAYISRFLDHEEGGSSSKKQKKEKQQERKEGVMLLERIAKRYGIQIKILN